MCSTECFHKQGTQCKFNHNECECLCALSSHCHCMLLIRWHKCLWIWPAQPGSKQKRSWQACEKRKIHPFRFQIPIVIRSKVSFSPHTHHWMCCMYICMCLYVFVCICVQFPSFKCYLMGQFKHIRDLPQKMSLIPFKCHMIVCLLHHKLTYYMSHAPHSFLFTAMEI